MTTSDWWVAWWDRPLAASHVSWRAGLYSALFCCFSCSPASVNKRCFVGWCLLVINEVLSATAFSTWSWHYTNSDYPFGPSGNLLTMPIPGQRGQEGSTRFVFLFCPMGWISTPERLRHSGVPPLYNVILLALEQEVCHLTWQDGKKKILPLTVSSDIVLNYSVLVEISSTDW